MGVCNTIPILLPLFFFKARRGVYPAVYIQIQEQLCEFCHSTMGPGNGTQRIRLAWQNTFIHLAILLALITHRSLLQSLCFLHVFRIYAAGSLFTGLLWYPEV